ncbi:hypothetical protein GETHOR_03610 [Geothrix oryzae]|uniref:Uncharacterized protein n=2 Tax=Geothrix oryzae TaxID=2927975 RepID=A0ABM8DN05_9BACT|nr:hypothetical protein GETHOR_03610 [Geothrix oryzae]
MCLSETLTLPVSSSPFEFEEDMRLPEPPDPYAEAYWSIRHLIEGDLNWLEEEPRHEGNLLLRYFGNHVPRMKDVLEYRGLLRECLAAVPGRYVVLPMPDFTPSYGLDQAEEHDA